MIAIGVNEEGYREILDIAPMESEAVSTYSDFFDGLKERGMEKVDLIISDGHKGIKLKELPDMFPGNHYMLSPYPLQNGF